MEIIDFILYMIDYTWHELSWYTGTQSFQTTLHKDDNELVQCANKRISWLSPIGEQKYMFIIHAGTFPYDSRFDVFCCFVSYGKVYPPSNL